MLTVSMHSQNVDFQLLLTKQRIVHMFLEHIYTLYYLRESEWHNNKTTYVTVPLCQKGQNANKKSKMTKLHVLTTYGSLHITGMHWLCWLAKTMQTGESNRAFWNKIEYLHKIWEPNNLWCIFNLCNIVADTPLCALFQAYLIP